ncbi:MarR family winged helix-turn-helix transcriptional regulator [Actinomadura sp. NEAU-AAG7]|uniref:MarR family winged helix-turn-helix transcriptional regulator n=1 Tax=Actinomadura sp. NEAU-AAG7 TaxID=2839640 RepID=UPI001BE4D7B3|nr:MarR family winged helix-turn-helix transcriptional regulator [Actinomadura sp. NEAU-AAG7]MBT2213541.1 MarR family winged helix-turn-helix transcriptional regulator [Actinomadura sp. NEAU-AAG7]
MSSAPAGPSGDPPGFELPLRLFLAFRTIIDEAHEELARQGHPDMRPMHGFVFQAIGPHGTTAVELGRRLGVSKQAAGKMVESLERLGYVERAADPADARRKIVRLTAHGVDSLVRSAEIFERIRDAWTERLGADRVRALEADLKEIAPTGLWRLDAPGWFGTA